MLRFLFVVGLLFWLGHARAAGYDDFSRGVSASSRHDDDAAISLFGSALAAGDLNASLQPVAYFDRGRLYLRKGDYDRALADFSSALNLKPNYQEALEGRAEANVGLGNFPAASTDLAAAIKRNPVWTAYYARGRVRYYAGDFMGSAEDLRQALKIEPQNPYPAIWLGLAEMRTGHFNAWNFGREISELNYGDWPYPLLLLLEGNRSPESVMRTATREDDKGMQCEADFYLAEWNLISDAAEQARTLLQQATDICPRGYIEREGVHAELSKLH